MALPGFTAEASVLPSSASLPDRYTPNTRHTNNSVTPVGHAPTPVRVRRTRGPVPVGMGLHKLPVRLRRQMHLTPRLELLLNQTAPELADLR